MCGNASVAFDLQALLSSARLLKGSGSIALGDVYPPYRRRVIAAWLDAFQEIRKIGLQDLRILCRRHTVDTGGTIKA
jgi:hypothetical protein